MEHVNDLPVVNKVNQTFNYIAITLKKAYSILNLAKLFNMVFIQQHIILLNSPSRLLFTHIISTKLMEFNVQIVIILYKSQYYYLNHLPKRVSNHLQNHFIR